MSSLTVAEDAVDLVDLLSDMIPSWFNFGVDLGISVPRLKEFKDDKGVDQCFIEMLRKWLTTTPTWNDLVEALKRLGNSRLANQIENEYIHVIKGMH